MEKGDIGYIQSPTQACLFEGLLASPPPDKKGLRSLLSKKPDNWDEALKLWVPHELPLKSLIDTTNRLGIVTYVFTLLGDDSVDAIYRWLLKKGVACPVEAYPNIETIRDDLKYNRRLSTLYVAEEEHAKVVGIRATVVSPISAWGN
jgi:hypothetical protein